MSAFKNAIKKDIKGVFLNFDEFADNHIVNGQNVVCVIDTAETAEKPNGSGNFVHEGVFLNTITLYIATADIDVKPVEGELIEIDATTYVVRKVNDECGILVIIVEGDSQ